MKQQKLHTIKRKEAAPTRGVREGIFNLLMAEAVHLQIWDAGGGGGGVGVLF